MQVLWRARRGPWRGHPSACPHLPPRAQDRCALPHGMGEGGDSAIPSKAVWKGWENEAIRGGPQGPHEFTRPSEGFRQPQESHSTSPVECYSSVRASRSTFGLRFAPKSQEGKRSDAFFRSHCFRALSGLGHTLLSIGQRKISITIPPPERNRRPLA